MSTEGLDFGRDYRVSEAHRALIRVVNDAVDAVGLMVAAGACGTRTQDLSDALCGRPNRYVRVEWLLAIADIAPIDFKVRIANAMVAWMGLKVEAQRPLTDRERLSRLEQRAVARFGQAGLELVEENRR